MTKPTFRNPFKHLRATDIRAAVQLTTQATLGVTRIVEGVHQSVWNTLGASGGKEPGQTRGITGLVYKGVRSATQWVGQGVDTLLATIQPLLTSAESSKLNTPQREAVLAVLNGIMGDHLADSKNALVTDMSFRYQGEIFNPKMPPNGLILSAKIVLMIHGLCMNDRAWQAQQEGAKVGHAEVLASKLGYTPIYLRYNTGLHIAQNGRELAKNLEQLISQWPTALLDLSVVAHSMGGLVIRSAIHYAKLGGLTWPSHLKNIVFLGTPHQGAPLERAGHWVDQVLLRMPFTAPFVSLGQLRSAGITDLRFGKLIDEDVQNQRLPLPEAVACYTIAATLASKRSALADHLLGDGLVPLNSALGIHSNPMRSLVFAKPSQWITYQTGHMALLTKVSVTEKLVSWLDAK